MCKVLIALDNGLYNGKNVKRGDIVEVEDRDRERRHCQAIRNLIKAGPKNEQGEIMIKRHLMVCRSCRAWNVDREAANGL